MVINEIFETFLFGFLQIIGICLVAAFVLFIVATTLVVFICIKFLIKRKKNRKRVMNLENALKLVLDKYSIKKEGVAKYSFLGGEDDSFPNDNCTLFVVLKNGQKIFEDFSGGM